ncbi:Uncharacterized protein Fot_33025 [Forsythia ovata]|uniref:Uncharacterized protein n=1 Tax=Forsythia ovata TaxID=205694 RepID=A0ABD1TA18_9LAMI
MQLDEDPNLQIDLSFLRTDQIRIRADQSSDPRTNPWQKLEVSLLSEAAVIFVDRTHETYAIVLKVKAPTVPPPLPTHVLDPARRAPIDLSQASEAETSRGFAYFLPRLD